jgi:hypothetical protein
MTSQRKIESNRRNAKLSTGPKTERGKAASRVNATKHGLSAAPRDQIERSRLVEDLAAFLSQAESREPAVIVAAMTDYIARIDRLRLRTMSDALHGLKPIEVALKEIALLSRYQTRAFSKRNKAIKDLEEKSA